MTESFSDGLRKFSKKLESVVSQKWVPFDELFPPGFMSRYTQFSNYTAFFTGGGFDTSSQEALEASSSVDALDAHVKAGTSFESWGDMKRKAYEEWAQRKMK